VEIASREAPFAKQHNVFRFLIAIEERFCCIMDLKKLKLTSSDMDNE
jgi:hypothetical protein